MSVVSNVLFVNKIMVLYAGGKHGRAYTGSAFLRIGRLFTSPCSFRKAITVRTCLRHSSKVRIDKQVSLWS
jgi:hypothetical protein